MGKPLKYTEEEVIAAIKNSAGIISVIAEKLNCSWNTAHKYINEYDFCKIAYMDEEERVLDLSESQMIKAIEEGDRQMIRWHLGTKGKKRGYTERHEFEDVTDLEKQREKFKTLADQFKDSVNE